MTDQSQSNKPATYIISIITCIAALAVVPEVRKFLDSPDKISSLGISLTNVFNLFIFAILIYASGHISLLIILIYLPVNSTQDPQHINIIQRLDTLTNKFIFGLFWFGVVSLIVNLVKYRNVDLDILMVSGTWLFTMGCVITLQVLIFVVLIFAKKREMR